VVCEDEGLCGGEGVVELEDSLLGVLEVDEELE
jgi:hypothetical protein